MKSDLLTRIASLRGPVAAGLAIAISAPLLPAQQQSIDAQRPSGSVFIRPYRSVMVPPARLNNSFRIRDLIRGGKLYLTAQDAIALALENNIDLEIARYQPLIDQWNVELYEAGGALPGVPSGQSQVSSVTSGQGVSGSQQAGGVSSSNGTSSNQNSVGATISQIGPVTPSLDPVVQDSEAFTHRSSPQAESVQSQTPNLIQNTRFYNTSISEGYLYGGKVTLSYSDEYLNENAPSDVLNPSSATTLSISLQQNFLYGFGTALNSRNITVAKANLKLDDLNFRGQVISTVANVLNLYYGLVADYEDLRAKQSASQVAQTFFENNKKQVQIGTMAPIDVTTAEAQVASSQQDLVTSETNLQEQEVSLKNSLSRTGLADPLFREVQIIPLDRISVPEQDTLPPLKELIATAMAKRTDIQANTLSLKSSQTSALGTANGVLPQLAGLAGATNQGLSGAQRIVGIYPSTPQSLNGANSATSIPPGYAACPPNIAAPFCEYPNGVFLGGIGTALGQTIRRDFPTERGGGFIAPVLRNRQALADQTIDQLGLRQTELENQKSVNQIAVDVSNQAVGSQQARVRYLAAVRNRILEQQLLEAEQKRFSLGASTTFLVVQQQRDLATAQSSEVAALVAYSNAQVSLDQTLGTTLETNHISVQEALNGRLGRASTLPATLPEHP